MLNDWKIKILTDFTISSIHHIQLPYGSVVCIIEFEWLNLKLSRETMGRARTRLKQIETDWNNLVRAITMGTDPQIES